MLSIKIGNKEYSNFDFSEVKTNQRIKTLEEKRIKYYCSKKGKTMEQINQNDLEQFIEDQLEVVSVDLKTNFTIYSISYCDDEICISIASSDNIKFDLVFDYHKNTFWLDDQPYDNDENLKYWIVVEYVKAISKNKVGF